MRLLVVSQNFWPENFQINDILSLLVQQGHEVDVLTGYPNYPEGQTYNGYNPWRIQREKWKGINIIRVPTVPRFKSRSFNLALNYISFVISASVIAPFLFRGKICDAIFVYGTSPIIQCLPASLLGWIKKTPVALWVQDLWPESVEATGHIKNIYILALIKALVCFVYSRTDLILVQSQAFVNKIKSMTKNVNISYLPNSINNFFLDDIFPHEVKLQSLKSGFNIVFAGNIGEAQAIPTILDVAENLCLYKDIKFIFFGSGSKAHWLNDQIKKKGLDNVVYEGRYPLESMPSIINQSSVMLVSLTNDEIFSLTIPNKIQAYMASGKPIIASLNGEGARLVELSGSGKSCAAENASELSKVVIQFYKMNNSDLIKMGNNGRDYFKSNFSMDSLCKELIMKLGQLI